jgi:hypothetical protein
MITRCLTVRLLSAQPAHVTCASCVSLGHCVGRGSADDHHMAYQLFTAPCAHWDLRCIKLGSCLLFSLFCVPYASPSRRNPLGGLSLAHSAVCSLLGVDLRS